MTDAVVIPCCGNSYCDDCIRSALLDSEEHICYTCKQSDVSPDNLIANKFLRQAVNNFKNETGYTKHGRKQVQHAAPLPPRPQLVRPLQSRQQDPLLVNVANPPSASAPTIPPKVEVTPPAPSAAAPPVPAPPPVSITTSAPSVSTTTPTPSVSTTSAAPSVPDASTSPATPSPPHAEAGEHKEASPVPAPVVDCHSPVVSKSQGEPPPPGESDPEPHVTRASSGTPERPSQSYSLPVIGHLPPARPSHPPGHQTRSNQSHRGGNRHWYRNRGEHPSTLVQSAPPPAPALRVYPPTMYPPAPQPYIPQYSSGPGLIPPPTISFHPQPLYAPGPPGLNPPWVTPGAQPPLMPLPPSLPQPPLSKEDFYRQRHHRQD
ncbi:hypothetical protein XENOCAPTIV_021234, partial [Xenoophorus captivus]